MLKLAFFHQKRNSKNIVDWFLKKRVFSTRSLPMKSKLVIIGKIYSYHFKYKYPKSERLLRAYWISGFLLHFWKVFWKAFLNKNEPPHSLTFFWNYWLLKMLLKHIKERRQWRRSVIFIFNFEQISHCSGVSIIDFEQVNAGWVVLWPISEVYLELILLPTVHCTLTVHLFRSIFFRQ